MAYMYVFIIAVLLQALNATSPELPQDQQAADLGEQIGQQIISNVSSLIPVAGINVSPELVQMLILYTLIPSIFSFVAGMWYMGRGMKKSVKIINRSALEKAPYIGLIRRIDVNQIYIIPMEPVTSNVFRSMDPDYNVVLIKKNDTEPISLFGKPAYIAIGNDPIYIAQNPKILESIGVSYLAISDSEELSEIAPPGDKTASNVTRYLSAITEKLLSHVKTLVAKIPVGKDMILSIAIDPFKVADAIASLTSYNTETIIYSIPEISQNMERIQRIVEEDLKARAKAFQTRLTTIAIVIFIIVMVAVITYIILREFGVF